MRKPIVAGNWKMHCTVDRAVELASAVCRGLDGFAGADVVLCPPFTALTAVGRALDRSCVQLGAQDAHWETRGAHTGNVSGTMLRDVGCVYVIVGHSERRAAGYDNDETVRRKALAALDAGLKPIVCVGETLEQREQGCTEQVVQAQLENGLRDLALSDVVVAYEPVWAIGTGRTATAEQAQSVHVLIREVAGSLAGSEIADALRIQYGGSVKPDNAAELFARPDVDGGLIGGASLDVESFVRIVKSV